MSDFIHVANADSVQPNQPICVSANGREIAIVLHEGSYFAFDRSCPHKRTPLDQGAVADGKIYCPMHGWGFELGTGACDTNPDRPLKTYPVRIENGQLQIQLT